MCIRCAAAGPLQIARLKWHVHNGELIALAQRTHSTKVEAAILDVYQLRSGQSPLDFQV